MGQLVEGAIPQIFNGVSRQPHSVRFPGQVQEAENVIFSVETGGFAKRLGTRIKKKLTGLTTGQNRKLHIINRDASERYRVVLSTGSIRVFDENYDEKTVTIDADNLDWLDDDPDNFSLLSALDYTFIVKRTDVAQMGATVAPAAPSVAVFYVAATPEVSAASSYFIKIDGVQKADYAANITEDTTASIAENLRGDLVTNLGAGWSVSRSGSYIFVKKNDGSNFTVSTEAPRGDTALVSYRSTVETTSKAPARALHGMMLNVRGSVGAGFWIKFTANNGVSGEGYWQETVTPGTKIAFDASTMPRALVRNEDGTFTLSEIDWAEKGCGGDDDVPPPEFVGERIHDLVFIRNRLGIVAGETVYFSRAGDYFNFWPESTTQLLDTDPFGLSNTTNQVSRFFYAVPFRRSTFIMGDNAQFEIGGTLLTPTLASIDLATSYPASSRCRPVAVGDELYFPAEVGKVSAIMSYTFDDTTVSETALDVTKHIEGYIPSPVVELVGDPIRGFLGALSASERGSLFVHRFYYQQQDRVQSAWSKHTFGGAVVRSVQIIDGVLVLLVEWKDAVWLWELPNVEDIYGDFDWTPRLDANQLLTGTYDEETNRTTWELGFEPTDPVAVTSNGFPEGKRMLSLPLTISGTTVYASGDWSDADVMLGENFNASVELSRQFLRNENGTSIISGRLQLRYMSLRYTGTGFFTVTILPRGRDEKKWTFSGRILGSILNLIQKFSILDGTFRFGINSNAETVRVLVGSDKFMPFTIVSAVWTGFFTETTRQG